MTNCISKHLSRLFAFSSLCLLAAGAGDIFAADRLIGLHSAQVMS